MKSCKGLLIFIALVGLAPRTHAQDGSGFGFKEIYLSDGILTSNQILGMLGVFNGPASSFVSFPSFFTGGQYLTVKFFKRNRVSLRIAGGFETATGQLSYGNEHGPFNGYDGVSGSYVRSVYTVAGEVAVRYISTPRFTFYGMGGIGASIENMTYNFNSGIPDQAYFYGYSTSLVPTSHYSETHVYPNMQFSPVGLRFGGPLAFYLELGLGYRGLVSGGICYRF